MWERPQPPLILRLVWEKMGKKTLLVDADPQGNATSGVAIDKSKVKFSTYSILVDGAKAEQCVLTTPYDNLHILPSSLDLAAAELEIAEKPHREALLKMLCSR